MIETRIFSPNNQETRLRFRVQAGVNANVVLGQGPWGESIARCLVSNGSGGIIFRETSGGTHEEALESAFGPINGRRAIKALRQSIEIGRS